MQKKGKTLIALLGDVGWYSSLLAQTCSREEAGLVVVEVASGTAY